MSFLDTSVPKIISQNTSLLPTFLLQVLSIILVPSDLLVALDSFIHSFIGLKMPLKGYDLTFEFQNPTAKLFQSLCEAPSKNYLSTAQLSLLHGLLFPILFLPCLLCSNCLVLLTLSTSFRTTVQLGPECVSSAQLAQCATCLQALTLQFLCL